MACSLGASVVVVVAYRYDSVVVGGVVGQVLLENQLGFDRLHHSRRYLQARER